MKFIAMLAIIFVLTPFVKNEIKVNEFSSNEFLTRYVDLAVYMVKRFISPLTNTLVIIERCEFVCRGENKYQITLLTKILQGLGEHLAIQLFLGHYNDRLWDYNLFIVDSLQAFMILRNSFPMTVQERNFNFFILLTWSSNNKELHTTVYEICKSAMRFNVKSVVIMSYSIEFEYIGFYTYDMFFGYNCQDGLYVWETNRFVNGSLKKPCLFPKLTSNFSGCRLNITARITPPLLMFNGDTNNETHLMEMKRVTGVEGDILKVLSKALNFKFVLNFPEKTTHEINSYFNSTGCFADLERNHAQVAIGAFSTTMRNGHKFSTSYVYHSTQYVFAVRSGLCFGPFKQLLNPLCPSTWLLLLTLVTVSVVFTKCVKKYPIIHNFLYGPKNKQPIRTFLAILLGNPIPTLLVPKRNFARFLLAAWLLLSFEIRNGYQGKMFDSLRFSNRIPVPKKISQLLEEEYILLSPLYKEYFPSNKTVIMPNTTQRLDFLQNSNTRVTTTILLDTLAHYNLLNWNSSTLTYVDETIFNYPCAMYFQKHSLLRLMFDRKLKAFSDAGIISHIAKKHIHKRFQSMNWQSQFVSKLTNKNLRGLYLVNMVFCLIAVFVFILELLTRKSETLRKIMDELNSW